MSKCLFCDADLSKLKTRKINHIKRLQQLSGQNFWLYVKMHAEELMVQLSNDGVSVSHRFPSAKEEECGTLYADPSDPLFYRDIPNGLCDLLSAFNINYEII